MGRINPNPNPNPYVDQVKRTARRPLSKKTKAEQKLSQLEITDCFNMQLFLHNGQYLQLELPRPPLNPPSHTHPPQLPRMRKRFASASIVCKCDNTNGRLTREAASSAVPLAADPPGFIHSLPGQLQSRGETQRGKRETKANGLVGETQRIPPAPR